MSLPIVVSDLPQRAVQKCLGELPEDFHVEALNIEDLKARQYRLYYVGPECERVVDMYGGKPTEHKLHISIRCITGSFTETKVKTICYYVLVNKLMSAYLKTSRNAASVNDYFSSKPALL